MLLGIGSQSFGRLTESEQGESGAMVRLNDTTLSGSSSTREISGDANFALGRSTVGSVTTKSGAETLTGNDNRAYHYVAFNGVDALPASGTASCDAGVFTTPTNTKGPAPPAAAPSRQASRSSRSAVTGPAWPAR